MNQFSLDARNVRLKSATLIRYARREADRPFAPADRFQQRFLRATKSLRKKKSIVPAKPSLLLQPRRLKESQIASAALVSLEARARADIIRLLQRASILRSVGPSVRRRLNSSCPESFRD